MSLEVTLLRLLQHRERYERLARAVPRNALESRSQYILDDFGKYFAEFPDVERLELEPFSLWFFSFAHPTLTEEQRALYRALLANVIEQDCDPALEDGILERLLASETAGRVIDLITQYNNGDEVDLYVSLRAEVDRYEQQTKRKTRVPWVSEDIDSILADDKNDRGLHWRLPCLNQVMRGLRGGDFLGGKVRPDEERGGIAVEEVARLGKRGERVYLAGREA